jgi:hypothetical protein
LIVARRKKKSQLRIVLTVIAVAAAITASWFGVHRLRPGGLQPAAATTATAERVDPANEGRTITIHGKLEITAAPRDAQLGISADAALLFRHVEMYQWREHCDGGDCRYEAVWLAEANDSHKFRVPAGHENPAPPFAAARFAAGEIHLGAFTVDAQVAAQLPATDYPVHASALPPNLAASFRESGGMLYAGGDPAQPAVGAVRVSYRILSAGNVSLTGVQHGAKLVAN